MRIAQLKIVSEDATPDHVLETMQASGHAAAVVLHGTGFRLVTADEVLRGLRDGTSLAAVVKKTNRPLITGFTKTRGWTDSPEDRYALEAFLRQTDDRHALLEVDGDVATVATADELFQGSLNVHMVLCRCSKDPSHVWQPEELSVQGKCNFDDAAVTCK